MYTPPPFPAGLAPNRAVPSARLLQLALKTTRFLPSTVNLADNYGPQTQMAVARFNGNGVVAISSVGWTRLFVQAYGEEPPQDMTRVTYSGRTINKRTRSMLNASGSYYLLTQGSYNPGVTASGGTHDGGGVVDVSVSDMSNIQRGATVFALRKTGFAAWLRTPAEGFPYHIHAVAIGDAEMSPAAQRQVGAYFNGRNGLADDGPDTFNIRTYPTWALKYDR